MSAHRIASADASRRVLVVRASSWGALFDFAHKWEGEHLQGMRKPAGLRAQLEQVQAQKARDEALLANQKIDLARYEQLAATNAGSKQQADTQRALVAQQEAIIKADQAQIDNARTTLGYTKIVAPISGRAGLRQLGCHLGLG